MRNIHQIPPQTKFHRLTVLVNVESTKDGKAQYAVECDCGTWLRVQGQHLRSGNTKSCGCLKREKSTTHGQRRLKGSKSGTGAYNSWRAMIQRCTNSRNKFYWDYGGRGIKVCPEWLESFAAFYADMGDRPEGKTLDRKAVDGDYTKENCRWATGTQQALNKRPKIRDLPIDVSDIVGTKTQINNEEKAPF